MPYCSAWPNGCSMACAPPTSLCRYGGEELLVVMPDADAEEAVRRINAIASQGKLGARIMVGELPPVTFSAGVATLPEHGENGRTTGACGRPRPLHGQGNRPRPRGSGAAVGFGLIVV